MNSDSKLISAIEHDPRPANFKEADTGKYVVANASNARQLGMENANSMVGLTIHDMSFLQPDWGREHANTMEKLDFHVRDKKIFAYSKHPFLDARFEEVTKSPVFGYKNKILGIVSRQRDLTSELSYSGVYELYRYFYSAPEAIKRMLGYLGIEQCFTIAPTEAPFRIFLAKAERLSNKEVGRLLDISHRSVDYQFDMLRNRVVDGDLRRVLSLVKRRGA